MRQNIQIKILKKDEKSVLTNYVTSLDFNPSETVLNQKTVIKSSISNFETFDIQEEILWHGNKKLKDDELMPLRSGLEYNLIVK